MRDRNATGLLGGKGGLCLWMLVLLSAVGCQPSDSRTHGEATSVLGSGAENEMPDVKDLPSRFVNSLGMRMVLIPGGGFWMGIDVSDESILWPSRPRHRVELDSFYMSAYEVTKGQFRKFVEDTGGDILEYWEFDPSATTREKRHAYDYAPSDLFPVYLLDWHTAVRFCEWLSEKEGRRYRLPTEAEWEYAARAGTETFHWWGNEWEINMAANSHNTREGSPFGRYAVGGTHPVNPWGLYDMLGNAGEWMLDWYEDDYYSRSPKRNPPGPGDGEQKTMRGGSGYTNYRTCNSVYRIPRRLDWRGEGIRLVCELGPGFAAPLEPTSRGAPALPVQDLPRLQVDLGKGISLEMLRIEPGTFMMGSPPEDEYRGNHEHPQTEVTLTKPFWIGVTEVTQAQYEVIMGENPSVFDGSNRPVENMMWREARWFCVDLTDRERAAGRLPEGELYRLPSEAEWEYCCRAGTSSRFCYGDDPPVVVTHGVVDNVEGTRPVGQRFPNGWGLHDMHGNVWEWCLGQGGRYPGKPVSDLVGERYSGRPARGGAWAFPAHRARSSSRYWLQHSTRHAFVGFRLVRGPSLVEHWSSRMVDESRRESRQTGETDAE